MAAGVQGSNYLMQTDTVFALDALRPFSAPLRGGARMMLLVNGAAIPTVRAASTGTWLADETTQIDPSQADIGQTVVESHEAGILTKISHKLSRQTDIDRFMRRELLRPIGATLDTAILGGTGTDGQPLGIVATTGVGTVSGTSFSGDDAAEMLEQVSTADDQPGLTRLAAPGVRKLLSRRPVFSGAGSAIWSGQMIDGFPAFASRVCLADSLILGDFQELIVALFSDGLEIQTNPFSDERTGVVSYRAWLSADIGISTLGSFSVAVSIT